jgi:succinate dehydrogenase flavin-adding protein (antitoxin of CptAB toxin-antitoxin module)
MEVKRRGTEVNDSQELLVEQQQAFEHILEQRDEGFFKFLQNVY